MKYNIIMLSIFIMTLIFKIMKHEPNDGFQFSWVITIVMTPFAIYWIYQICIDVIAKRNQNIKRDS
jgi:Na+/melibiose symporter-like transporter